MADQTIKKCTEVVTLKVRRLLEEGWDGLGLRNMEGLLGQLDRFYFFAYRGFTIQYFKKNILCDFCVSVLVYNIRF